MTTYSSDVFGILMSKVRSSVKTMITKVPQNCRWSWRKAHQRPWNSRKFSSLLKTIQPFSLPKIKQEPTFLVQYRRGENKVPSAKNQPEAKPCLFFSRSSEKMSSQRSGVWFK